MLRVTRMTRRAPPRPLCDRCKPDRLGLRPIRHRPCATCSACECRFCDRPIEVGQVYRLRYWVSDTNDDPPVSVAHEDCIAVYGDPYGLWALTETRDGRAARRARARESLAYIAKAYKVHLEPGQRVTVPWKGAKGDRRVGCVVKGTHNVLVKLRRTSEEVKAGARMSGWWHPSEVKPVAPRRCAPKVQAPPVRPVEAHDDLPF